MDELTKQIDKLILTVEVQKARHMIFGQPGDLREDDGYLQALKFIKLLINTNLRVK